MAVDDVFDDEECLVENSINEGGDDGNEKICRRTINVMYLTMFIGSISFSIVMSSLWPFLRKMDEGVSETFLGWVNASYSLAQLIFSIVFGYWSDHRASIEPLLLSILFLLVGSGFYAYAEAFGTNGIWVILIARILLGASAGNLSVCRAVGAHLSTSDTLAKTMSHLSMVQAIGFFVGPGLQAAARPIGSKTFYIPSIKFYFNIYTAPCYLLIILSIINFVLIMKYFREDVRNSKQAYQHKEGRRRKESKSFEPVNKIAIGVTLIVYFVGMSVFALNETILSPVLMTMFAWSETSTVFYGGIILAVSGMVAVVCFLLIPSLSRRFSDKCIIVGGYLILVAGFVIYLPWGPGYLKLTMAELRDANGTIIDQHGQGNGGCPYQYEWCHDLPKLPLPQFLVGATLIGIGFPISVVLINILYSKIVGPFPQGLYMGWFSAIGSLARVVGPLYVTFMFTHLGFRWVGVCTASMLSLSLIILGVFWKQVLPYESHRRFESIGSTTAMIA